jgi:hypothetical protein
MAVKPFASGSYLSSKLRTYPAPPVDQIWPGGLLAATKQTPAAGQLTWLRLGHVRTHGPNDGADQLSPSVVLVIIPPLSTAAQSVGVAQLMLSRRSPVNAGGNCAVHVVPPSVVFRIIGSLDEEG